MFPGMNPRQMKMAMKKMGIKQEEIEASQVIIRLADREIVLENPSIQKVNMMGQWSYQISGDEHVRSIDNSVEITDEDIEMVASQANVSKEEAKKAIEEADGDIASAIMALSED